MILSAIELNAIKTGRPVLVVRRWRRPSVKKGSVITTAVGRIRVDDIGVIDEAAITTKDAKSAGYENKEALFGMLNKYPGDIYKIKLSYHSEDPRLALRDQKLTSEMLEQLRTKMERLDKSGKNGAWTRKVLQAINDHPMLRAADLCKKVEMEKMKMKLNVRKLKNLGLTISHEVGYEISPLGKEFLKNW